MTKTLGPLFSFVLLVVGIVLTQVSSPDYAWVMSVSLVCALTALAGFWLSGRRRGPAAAMTYRVLAAVGGLVAIYSLAAIVNMGLKR
jgi:thiol:disulfide interchange protein